MSIIRYKNFESNPATKVVMMKGDTHKLYCTNVFTARGFSTNASGQEDEHKGCQTLGHTFLLSGVRSPLSSLEYYTFIKTAM